MENFVQTRVYISSTMDVKSRVGNWWKKLKLKAAFQHIGLLVIFGGYTVAGGWVSILFILVVIARRVIFNFLIKTFIVNLLSTSSHQWINKSVKRNLRWLWNVSSLTLQPNFIFRFISIVQNYLLVVFCWMFLPDAENNH